MVKLKQFLLAILFCLLANSCNIDFFGLVASTELDDRLKDRDKFVFLSEDDRNNLSLGDSYSFIILTDTHMEDGKTFGFENLQSALDSNSNVKFVVITGDITQHGSARDIDNFINIAESLSVPVYPVIGNHDIYFGNWSVWRRKIGSTNYRINADTATLLILDTANAYFGKKQLDWLERELGSVNKNVFVFFHANLFADGLLNLQQVTNTNERARIIYLLRDRCDMVFMGHSHKRQHNKAGRTEYIVIEDFKTSRVYCLVTVSASGINYEFKRL